MNIEKLIQIATKYENMFYFPRKKTYKSKVTESFKENYGTTEVNKTLSKREF